MAAAKPKNRHSKSKGSKSPKTSKQGGIQKADKSSGAQQQQQPKPKFKRRQPVLEANKVESQVRVPCTNKAYQDFTKSLGNASKSQKYNKIDKPVVIDSRHDSSIKSMYVSEGGKIASSDVGGKLKFWELRGTQGAMVCSHVNGLPERIPEDFAWHPDEERVFTVYNERTEEAQVAIFSSSTPDHKLLGPKPHDGSLRCIRFMPWTVSGAPCFVTGGDDHSVVLWSATPSGGEWVAQKLHNFHTSAVYGLTGSPQKNVVLSASLDRTLRVYDVVNGQFEPCKKIESALLAVDINPVDPNLFMVVGCTAHEQIMLHDMRCYNIEQPLHKLGWPLGKSLTSRQIQQCWSPNGLYVSTGTCDNLYHVFDIRYNGVKPAHTVQGHTGHVMKAQWHTKVTSLVLSISRPGHFWLQEFS